MRNITHVGRYLLTLLALLAVSSWCSAQETRQKLAVYAKRLPFLIADAFFSYDRYVHDDLDPLYRDIPPKEQRLYRQVMEELMTANYPTQDLLALLKHQDAKVRTLAILALFAKEDPKMLPDIYALVKDAAPTFGAPPMNLSAMKALRGEPKTMPKLKPQTVGNVAQQAIKAYLDVGGVRTFVRDGQLNVSGFEKYWAARKQRSHCAIWFALRFQRATQGTSPFPERRIPLLKALRRDIDHLPADDRTWTLLYLTCHLECLMTNEQQWGYLVTPAELVQMCQQLGQKKLLNMLANEKVSDDPDLQANAPISQHIMRTFVLRHARELFDREAGAKLLLIEPKASKHFPMALWAIAAAELQPERATAILKDAWKLHLETEYDRDHELLPALWRLAGNAEAKFLLEAFYGGKGEPGSFLNVVANVRPKENRAFLARLVRDPRFDQMNWYTLRRLLPILNGWAKQPIVTDEELQSLQHPLGVHHFIHFPKERARYPNETAQVLKTLASWRQKVRDSVLQWSP